MTKLHIRDSKEGGAGSISPPPDIGYPRPALNASAIVFGIVSCMLAMGVVLVVALTATT